MVLISSRRYKLTDLLVTIKIKGLMRHLILLVCNSQKKAAVLALILTLLIPVALPIPAWAWSDHFLPPNRYSQFNLMAEDPLAVSLAGFGNRFLGAIATFISPKRSEKTRKEFNRASLEKRVARLDLRLPENVVAHVGQPLPLTGIPVDQGGNPVNGLGIQWQSSSPQIVSLRDDQAFPIKEGDAKIIAFLGNVRREIKVTVTNESSNNNLVHSNSLASMRDENPLAPDDPLPLIDEDQAENLVTPENNLGKPIGQTELSSSYSASAVHTRERAGSANYSFDIPVVSTPGRGIDASVSVTYNSRVWNKSTGISGDPQYDFNVDQNWLAPGFQIGYGSLEGYSTSLGYGYLVTAPDGSRSQLMQIQTAGGCVTYEATDGTFALSTICGGYNTPSIAVNYADGSQITFGTLTASGKRFPTSIRDRNGNVISITYLANDTQGKIDYLKDTLNRYITFNYDTTAEKKLVAITVPGFGDSSSPRQAIRFYYETLDLLWSGHFQTPSQINAPSTVTVLRKVYFPGTQTGYIYDYSPYFAEICNISQRRGMAINSISLNDTGSVSSDGTEAASTHYNYPATAIDLGGVPLADVPKYSWRKDDWQGRTTAIPQTTFNSVDNTQPDSQGHPIGTRTATITMPDGTQNISISNIKAPDSWDNGLLAETHISTTQNGQERIWSKTKLYWEQGDAQLPGRRNPRLNKIEVTNDAGQIRAVSFGYDNYNNQSIVREHDFASENILGTELRRTETTYETGTGWINNRLLRLPKNIKVIANNTIVSKTEYEYDNYFSSPLANTPNVPQHALEYNPFQGTHPECHFECNGEFAGGDNQTQQPNCPDGTPPTRVCIDVPNYNSNYNFRGNVTKVTAFADPTIENDPKATITAMNYDMTGNVIEARLSCCRMKSFTYDELNAYAYQVGQARGDAGELTTSITYDRNTGLVTSTHDENNQPATYTYNSDNLRVVRIDGPTGSWATAEYNDVNYPYYVKTTGSLDATRSVSEWSFSDGRGQTWRNRRQSANGYVSSDVEFGIMGQPFRTYNPYTVSGINESRPNGVKFSELTHRDGLGRVLLTTLPDNTTTSVTYEGSVVTATDQAGKQRRHVSDALGHTVRVDEPTTGGLGVISAPTQPTYYEYDGNDNLIKATQSDGTFTQERLFRYDGLSRLTHERRVEADATLDDSGVKQTSGGLWTGVYKYNSDGLLVEGINARGVKATFTYDPLNRIHTIGYTGETGYRTPTVTYTYDETEGGFYNKGRLTKVQTAVDVSQGTPETVQNYRYDKVGRILKHAQSIGDQNYVLQYGYNLAGQLVTETYPNGKVVATTFDNFGGVSTVSDEHQTYLSGVALNEGGLLSQMNFGNGTNETYSYNDRLQMRNQILQRNSEVLQKYDYSYGEVNLGDGTVDASKNNGQLGKVESFVGTNKQWSQRFGYDELGRLTEAREYKTGDDSQLTYKQKFDFDRFGNLYRKQASNPTTGQQNPLSYTPIEDSDISKWTNKFTAGTGTVYDEAGEVITDGKFRSMGFSYDANGRMVKSTKSETPDTMTVYDALGNRVATKINDTWQFVVYDAFGKVVAEYGNAQPTQTTRVKYVQQDGQGSVRTVTNSNGFVVARMDFEAFGEEIGAGVGLRTQQQGYSALSATRQGYGLTEKDIGTGLNHALFRKNEPRAGRWTNPDPYNGSMMIGNPQSLNRYSYVGNQPTNFVDPSGLYWAVDWGSCYSEVVSNGEGGITFSGREICNLEWRTESPTGGAPTNVGGGSPGNTKKEETFEDCVAKATDKAIKRFTEKTTKKLGIAIAAGGLTIIAEVVVGAVLTTLFGLDPEPISKVVLGAAALATLAAILYYIDAYSDANDEFNNAIEDAQDSCKDKPGAPKDKVSGADVLKSLKKLI